MLGLIIVIDVASIAAFFLLSEPARFLGAVGFVVSSLLAVLDVRSGARRQAEREARESGPTVY